MRADLETTAVMNRDELLELIDTTRPLELQRITAEVSVPVLDELLLDAVGPSGDSCHRDHDRARAREDAVAMM